MIDLHPGCTIIVGENARGKTNMLEAIYMSVHGYGYREKTENELINWDAKEAVVETVWAEDNINSRFGIHLRNAGDSTLKKYYVQKSAKTAAQYVSYQTKAVLFAPEHIDIISGSPDKRREYINDILCVSDTEYKKKLHNFNNALYKRNKLIEKHKDINALKEELIFWNQYLTEQAQYVTSKRIDYVSYLNSHPAIDHRNFNVSYSPNQFTIERASEFFPAETRFRRSLIGPQKDEFLIQLEDKHTKAVRNFGSRSEQRLAVFWLKLNELGYFELVFKKRPILLLDDIFSELDVKNKALIINLIGKYQVVLTTTETELSDLVVAGNKTVKL